MSTSFNCPNCDAVIATSVFSASAPPPPPPPAPPPPPTEVPTYRAPLFLQGRTTIRTPVLWQRGQPSFYSGTQAKPAPLTDNNVWQLGFTAGADAASLSTAEYAGDRLLRQWALVDNVTGEIVAQGTAATQGPSAKFNGTSSRFAPRIPLQPGRRYTFNIWNAQVGSSPMVGQLYF